MTRRIGNHLVSCALTLGPRGRIAEKLERVGHREVRFAYEYDPKGRLVRVARDGRPVEEYGYDALGRRAWDWTRERGRRRLSYDGADRLRRAGAVEYYYGLDDTLACRRDRQGSLHLDYGRNLGLRSLHDRRGRAVNFRTSRRGQPLEKRAGGEAIESFRWLDLVRLAEYRSLDKGYRLAFHYRDGHRLPYAATCGDGEGSQAWTLGYDQVGSLKAVGDESGSLVKTIDYDSFGNVLSEDWPWLFIPIGFAGGLRDRDTGFVRFGRRDCDPDIGRFVAQDPAGDAGGDHDLYEYCVDDPVNAVDPKGLWAVKASLYPGGFGGGFGLGVNPDGTPFVSGEFGAGISGGVSYDPEGKSPGYDPSAPHSIGVGGFAQASAGAGPAKVGAKTGAGAAFNTETGEGRAYTIPLDEVKPTITPGGSGSIGIKGGVSAGVEVGVPLWWLKKDEGKKAE
ncbi:MAG: RHS repeat-associated core domain-containing protein [Thermodesulfobacteriota bacterium]